MNIHGITKMIRRLVRKMIHEFLIIKIHDIHIRFSGLMENVYSLIRNYVIIIDKTDPFAMRLFKSSIARTRNALVLLCNHLNERILPRIGFKHSPTVVRRTIIHAYDLYRSIILLDNAVQSCRQLSLCVVHRNEKTYKRLFASPRNTQ